VTHEHAFVTRDTQRVICYPVFGGDVQVEREARTTERERNERRVVVWRGNGADSTLRRDGGEDEFSTEIEVVEFD
jgi:ribosome maturation protein Sdo1